jgi:alginate O-acetyltransferase complex protein AlgI
MVFLLCGLWHGARWTFVCWGIFHGCLLILEKVGIGALVGKLPRPFRHLYALFFILISWAFFRAESLAQAGNFFLALVGLGTATLDQMPLRSFMNLYFFVIMGASILACFPLLGRIVSLDRWGTYHVEIRGHLPKVFYPGVLVLLTIFSFFSLATHTFKPFIYFKF